jgi:hemoglobin
MKILDMKFEITPVPEGEGRPQVTRPDIRLLDCIGEAGVRKLVSDHYDILRQSEIGEMFPRWDKEFEAAKLRSSDFFIQALGGPDYFNQNQGSPMLVSRHVHFRITPKAREIWLNAYKEILPKLDASEELIVSFWNYLNIFSIWMVNTKE